MDVSFLNQLVGTSYQLKSVDVAEIIGHLRTEDPARTSRVNCPILNILGVRPHQVAEWTLMRDLDPPVDGSNLIDRLDFGTEPTVNTEDFA